MHVDQRGVRISLDAAGEPLHRRGYRQDSGPAPLRETLAAGALVVIGLGSAYALITQVQSEGEVLVKVMLPNLPRRVIKVDVVGSDISPVMVKHGNVTLF